MRLNEALSLRIKDLDFDQHQITVRNAKGVNDRVTIVLNRGGRGVISPLDARSLPLPHLSESLFKNSAF